MNFTENLESLLPEGYKLKDNALYFLKPGKGEPTDVLLCNFIPYVVSEIILDSGGKTDRAYEIEGIDKNGCLLPRITIAEKDFDRMEWVRQNWGMICNIAPDFNAARRLRYVLQETADRAERKRHYVTTGWRELSGKWVYLSPGDPEHTVELENRLQGYGLCRKDDKSFLRLVPKLLDTVGPSNVMYPLVAYAFSSVLNRFLKQAGSEPKTILMLLGKTGSKKSTLAALVLSFFGSFSLTTLPMSFRDTVNSMESSMCCLNDTLTVVDDLHPSKHREKDKTDAMMQSICRMVGNRAPRGRLGQDCKPRPDLLTRCNLIVTAEQLPDVGESGTARLLPLRLRHGDVNNDALTKFQTLAADGELSAIMYQFTEYLKANCLCKGEEVFIKALRKLSTEYRKDLVEKAKRRGIKLRDRLIDDLVSLEFGARFLCGFLETSEAFSHEEAQALLLRFEDTFLSVGQEQQHLTVRDQPTHVFISKMMTLIDAKLVTLVRRNADALPMYDPGFVGYYDDDNYYFDKSLAHKAVVKLCREQNEDFMISEAGLREALCSEGISICDPGIHLKKIRVGNNFPRCICIPKEVMRRIAESADTVEADKPTMATVQHEDFEELII